MIFDEHINLKIKYGKSHAWTEFPASTVGKKIAV